MIRASVEVRDVVVGKVERGLCVFVGVSKDDTAEDARALAAKLARLRIFEDGAGKMNLDVSAVGGAVLAVPQFTLLADVRRGTRPSFDGAMAPGPARVLFDDFCDRLREVPLPVETGRFGQEMRVLVDNDGPVTILLDTKVGDPRPARRK